jgi:hypothetical protein
MFAFSWPAFAACKTLPLGEAPNSFLIAYQHRLEKTGTGEVFKVSSDKKFVMFKTFGTDVSLFINSTDNMISEVRGVLSSPAKDADIERLKIASSFALSRFGEVEEKAARSLVDSAFLRLGSQKGATEKAGRATIVVEQPEAGSWVYSVGRLDCS